MSRAIHVAVAGLLAALSILAGWRIVAHGIADSLVEQAPERALDWVGGQPEAQLSIARQQAAAGDPAAVATARRLLEQEPLQGDAWRLLGEAAGAAGDPAHALEYHAKALELTPRNATARIWMAQRLLQDGDHPGAIAQLDKLMRVFLTGRPQVFDYLAQLGADPVFRESLVQALAARPAWRKAFLQHLQQHDAAAGVADAVHGGLQAKGALSSEEFVAWTESLLRRGDWPQAYARWFASLPPGARLTPVYNGDFATRPSGRGFDWRTPASAGVAVDFPRSGGARIEYRNRRIDHAGLEQALLLAPGRYRLVARTEARDLRSDRGLEWVVQCARTGEVLGSAAMDGRGGTGPVEGEIDLRPDRRPGGVRAGQHRRGRRRVLDRYRLHRAVGPARCPRIGRSAQGNAPAWPERFVSAPDADPHPVAPAGNVSG